MNKCKTCGEEFESDIALNRHYKEKEHWIDRDSEDILRDENLWKRLTEEELEKKIVGEIVPRKAIFLSLSTIWVEGAHAHTFVSSESSAGKSYVTKNIYDLFPLDRKEYRTKISREVFTYWHNKKYEPDWSWDGKICYLEDVRNSILNCDTFKVMCSEGSRATVVIKQRAIDIEIEGKPTMVVTAAEVNPKLEIINRFNVISLDETVEQTEKIKERQARQFAECKKIEYDEELLSALEGLKERKVIIPYAEKAVKYFPSRILRARRDFPRFAMLIQASAALHQFQRKEKDGMIIAEPQDYENARECFSAFQELTTFGLTHKQLKAWEACRDYHKENKGKPINTTTLDEEPQETDGSFSAGEIRAFKPELGSKQTWYNYLDDLTMKGLLKINLVKRENSKREVEVYTPYDDTTRKTLPSYDEL